MTALYDQIGKKYDLTRQADEEIVQRLNALLDPQKGQHVLDVGCGSGNYTIALAKCGISITGLDISQEMLNKASAKEPTLTWILGDAKNLPFADNTFDGVLCFLALHHIREYMLFFREAYRVLKSNGKLLIFTDTPAQFMQLWLTDYFPKMMAQAAALLLSQKQVEEALNLVGFKQICFENYFVTANLQDAFLQKAKHHPELCLDKNFRSNTSPFALAQDQEEIQSGLERLTRDIKSNQIAKVIQRYPNSDGNFYYLFSIK